jgi:hypothetical protein
MRVQFLCEDYYPGGSIMPGRSFSSGSDYRYGYNKGSEKVIKEINKPQNEK